MRLVPLLAILSAVIALLSDVTGLELRASKKLREQAPPERLAAWQKTLIPGDVLCLLGGVLCLISAERLPWLYWAGVGLFCMGAVIIIVLEIRFRKSLNT